MAQKHIFGVEDNLVTCTRRVDPRIDWKLAPKVILKRDPLLIVACFVSLLEDEAFLCKVVVVQMEKNVDSACHIEKRIQ